MDIDGLERKHKDELQAQKQSMSTQIQTIQDKVIYISYIKKREIECGSCIEERERCKYIEKNILYNIFFSFSFPHTFQLNHHLSLSFSLSTTHTHLFTTGPQYDST